MRRIAALVLQKIHDHCSHRGQVKFVNITKGSNLATILGPKDLITNVNEFLNTCSKRMKTGYFVLVRGSTYNLLPQSLARKHCAKRLEHNNICTDRECELNHADFKVKYGKWTANDKQEMKQHQQENRSDIWVVKDDRNNRTKTPLEH